MTAKRKALIEARLVQLLLVYDGPQIALLQDPKGSRIIAAAVERDDMERPFFACEVRQQTLDRYLGEKVDLNYVFRTAPLTRHYFFDWSTIDDRDVIEMIRATKAEVEDDDFYPDPGVFARCHNIKMEGVGEQPSSKFTFEIDGRWEASDFSRFYGKIADVYGLISILRRAAAEDGQNNDTNKVANMILRRPWRGGGSYLGFYDDLYSDAQRAAPLGVARISYASPGQIELRGESEVFQDIEHTITMFIERVSELSGRYRELDNILRKERLKKAGPGSTFSSDAIAAFVQRRAFDFAVAMGLPSSAELFDMSGRNTLVYTKLVLSFYRRIKELYEFRAEGRVQPQRLTAAPEIQ
jgi:hypothetical protein